MRNTSVCPHAECGLFLLSLQVCISLGFSSFTASIYPPISHFNSHEEGTTEGNLFAIWIVCSLEGHIFYVSHSSNGLVCPSHPLVLPSFICFLLWVCAIEEQTLALCRLENFPPAELCSWSLALSTISLMFYFRIISHFPFSNTRQIFPVCLPVVISHNPNTLNTHTHTHTPFLIHTHLMPHTYTYTYTHKHNAKSHIDNTQAHSHTHSVHKHTLIHTQCHK